MEIAESEVLHDGVQEAVGVMPPPEFYVVEIVTPYEAPQLHMDPRLVAADVTQPSVMAAYVQASEALADELREQVEDVKPTGDWRVASCLVAGGPGGFDKLRHAAHVVVERVSFRVAVAIGQSEFNERPMMLAVAVCGPPERDVNAALLAVAREAFGNVTPQVPPDDTAAAA